MRQVFQGFLLRNHGTGITDLRQCLTGQLGSGFIKLNSFVNISMAPSHYLQCCVSGLHGSGEES